jgi:Mn-dependent DtxR family transcriptional regulator
MKYVKGQFVCLPRMLELNALKLKYTDTLIYCALRSFDNKYNGCYPAYETIAKRAGCSRDFVIKSIRRLKSAELISVNKSKKIKVVNRYSFSESYVFEQIPYQIFDEDALTLYEKSMLLCLRQFFIIGKLRCLYTLKSMAEMLGISYKIVHQQVASLIKKGYITQDAGVKKNLRVFTDKIDWNWDYENVFGPPQELKKLKVA